MSTFAAAFREIVTPQLRLLIRVQALFVLLDMVTFNDAITDVHRFAVKRGALQLPAQLQVDLEDWIGQTLLEFIDKLTPIVEKRQAIADRVARQIAQHEAQWLTK